MKSIYNSKTNQAMKTKPVAALAVIMALVMAACSDNDEPVVPKKQSYSIASSYVMPTSMKVADDSQIESDERPITSLGINFHGTTISPETDSADFARINRLFGDTACTKNAVQAWPKEYRSFLGTQLVSIKAIAADDSWGEKNSKGTDVSGDFFLNYLSATPYIESRYKDLDATNFRSMRMNKWQPSNGFALCDFMSLSLGHIRANPHYAADCPGHRYDLKVTFANGEELEAKGCLIYCRLMPPAPPMNR